MKKIKRYSLKSKPNGDFKSALDDFEPFDVEIVSYTANVNRADDMEIANRHYPLDFAAFCGALNSLGQEPRLVRLCGFETVGEIWEILSPFKESIESLHLFKCADIEDLSFFEQLPNLKTLDMYYNRKAAKLFNASKMPKLKKLEITDCNKLTDFSGLENSNLEYLGLFGCNFWSSNSPKLDVGEMNFLRYMPKLNDLRLAVKKTLTDVEYLKLLSTLQGLEKLDVGRNFFTFEQFAWLSAHLPNVKEGLEPCMYLLIEQTENEISLKERGFGIIPEAGEYYIIGSRKPRVKKQTAIKYLTAYNRLRARFKDDPEPPPSTFSIKI